VPSSPWQDACRRGSGGAVEKQRGGKRNKRKGERRKDVLIP